MPIPNQPHILLINPWIHDFAAYDVWAKPLGLLYLAALLESEGCRVSYIDCLDRFHPNAAAADPHARYGRGPYLKTPIPKPRILWDMPRTYSRYGIKPEWFRADLAVLTPPDLILVTALMTYWYPGVQECISHLREVFPDTPVLLGGIYATLCREHAETFSGADRVITGAGEARIWDIVRDYTGFRPSRDADPHDPDSFPYPAFHLQRKINYIPLLTSRGCPFSCDYCASAYLNPTFIRRSAEAVVEEVVHWHRKFGVRDFVFYDDALLTGADRHAVPMLEGIVRAGITVRFHTPNALHLREITANIADLMYRAGFHTLRLGLETTAFEARNRMDRKVTASQFMRAVQHLKAAGFQKEQVGAYLLAGLPDQSVAAVETSIRMVKESGITPVIAHYTPIPHTPMWPRAVAVSRYDLEADPVCANNAVFPCMEDGFSWEVLTRLKNMAAV